eukprot:scaffold190625_cov28-Tisochrysis_lutea.AAC.1
MSCGARLSGSMPSGASIFLSSPDCSAAMSSSQPPRWTPPMNICGTEVHPPARSAISLRSASELPTSTSVKGTASCASRAFAREQNPQPSAEKSSTAGWAGEALKRT